MSSFASREARRAERFNRMSMILPGTPHPKNPGMVMGTKGTYVFAPGNKFGPGKSPMVRASEKLRTALMASVTEEDIMEIMDSLVMAAKDGNITAAREVLDRTVGKVDDTAVTRRLEELEEQIAQDIVSKESAA